MFQSSPQMIGCRFPRLYSCNYKFKYVVYNAIVVKVMVRNLGASFQVSCKWIYNFDAQSKILAQNSRVECTDNKREQGNQMKKRGRCQGNDYMCEGHTTLQSRWSSSPPLTSTSERSGLGQVDKTELKCNNVFNVRDNMIHQMLIREKPLLYILMCIFTTYQHMVCVQPLNNIS